MIKNAIPLKIAGVGYSVPDTVITNIAAMIYVVGAI